MQHAQPLALEKLAMSAGCDYVTQQCRRIVNLPRPRDEQSVYWLTITNEAIQYLQDLVIHYIPCSLANEWLQKFLISLDKELYQDMKDRLSEQWCRLLTRQITVSLIPPTVTKLYCNRRWNFLLPEIYSALKTMKNLQHVKLGYQHDVTLDEYFDDEEDALQEWEEECVIGGIQHIKQIVTFSFESYCTDRIVTSLAEYHPGLCSLHLEYSRDVTDNIIPMILRFQCLQVLFLVGTSLSDAGIMTLLRQLPNGKKLRSYSRNGVTEEEIALLVQQCPNLSCVELMAEGCQDILPLRNLHNLKRLSISHIEFHILRDVLLDLGDQLLELELFSVLDVDVTFVGKTCISLKHLSISFCDSPVPVPEPEEQPVIESSPLGFVSLSEIELVVDECLPLVTYVLGHCFNLSNADINVCGDDDDRMVDSILRRNHLISLEQLRWCSSSTVELSFEAAKKILKNCHYLHTFVGPHKWRFQPDYDDFLQEMKTKYPGLQIS